MTRNSTAPARDVVDDLVAAGLIDVARAEEARRVVAGARPQTHQGGARALLVEIAGYLGGALVVAALGLFLAQQWGDFSASEQVVALAIISLLLGGAGAVVGSVLGGWAEARSGHDEVRRRLAAALLSAAAIGAGFTVATQVDRWDTNYSSWPAVFGGLTVVVLGVAAYAFLPSVLGQLTVAGASLTALIAVSEVLDEGTLLSGLLLLALGAGWLVLAELRAWEETATARVVGSGLGLFGAQMVMFEGDYSALAYALTAGVAVAGFALYLRTEAWPYLVVGVLAVTLVVPEAIIDWTDGSLGVAGGVLVAGLALLAAAVAGLRVRREVDER